VDPDPQLVKYFVPKHRVKNFLGREHELEEITTFFSAHQIQRPRILVLHALGGQGKSQIALEYCQRSRTTYRGMFWVNASSESTATQSLTSIGRELDESAVELLKDDHAKVQFVIRTLERWEGRWLMVFDNCDDPKIFSRIHDFIPSGMLYQLGVDGR